MVTNQRRSVKGKMFRPSGLVQSTPGKRHLFKFSQRGEIAQSSNLVSESNVKETKRSGKTAEKNFLRGLSHRKIFQSKKKGNRPSTRRGLQGEAAVKRGLLDMEFISLALARRSRGTDSSVEQEPFEQGKRIIPSLLTPIDETAPLPL